MGLNLHTCLSRSRLSTLLFPAPGSRSRSLSVVHLLPLLFRTVSWDFNFDRRSLETKMKRKNRSRFFDDDEELVADILLQVHHIIFQSESRLPFNWGFRRTRSAIDRSLPSHPKRKRTKLSYKKKKEDRLNTVDGLTHQREFLKSEEMENVTGLLNTLTNVIPHPSLSSLLVGG